MDGDTKLLDDVLPFSESNSIENVFLILGHMMFDHLP